MLFNVEVRYECVPVEPHSSPTSITDMFSCYLCNDKSLTAWPIQGHALLEVELRVQFGIALYASMGLSVHTHTSKG